MDVLQDEAIRKSLECWKENINGAAELNFGANGMGCIPTNSFFALSSRVLERPQYHAFHVLLNSSITSLLMLRDNLISFQPGYFHLGFHT
jgi:hypothetical protein